jgi:D-alanyl-D-alanine carboxypeptidase
MARNERSSKRRSVLSADTFLTSVYNRKRKVLFGTLVDAGWFSAAPDDTDVNRAIRTNNPGALNVSAWQRTRLGYVGQTKPDSAGNITTIYQAPEHGIAAWYFLLFDRYGFGQAGQFELSSVAAKYAGGNATPSEVEAYTDGWSKWSNGTLRPGSIIHFGIDDEILTFAKAVFAHEAAAFSPLHDDQILNGFNIERHTN